MITPSPRNDEREQRRVAALATAGLLLLLGATLLAVNVPEMETTRDLYRQLDPDELAQMQPSPDVEPEEPPEETTTEEEEAPDEAVEEETEPQSAPERVDLGDMADRQANVDLTPEESPGETEEPAEVEEEPGGADTDLQVQREAVGEAGGFDTFDDPSDSPVPRGQRGIGEGGEGDEGIAAARGDRDEEADDGVGFGDGGAVAGGQGRASDEAGAAIEVGLQEIDDFGDDYADIEIELLIEWMRENPAELPDGVKRHVGYESGNLTSIVPFEVEDEYFELYLMVREELMEVHVVIVHGTATRYLVDRSFTGDGRLFRMGTAQRDEEEIIASIRSQRHPLGEESEEFYEIFLSWWEQAKEEIEA